MKSRKRRDEKGQEEGGKGRRERHLETIIGEAKGDLRNNIKKTSKHATKATQEREKV